MDFDYQSTTKDAYKNRGVATRYHTDFTGRLSWRRFRFRYIARKERQAVALLLQSIPAKTVVDIPCGTGKLAPLLASRKCHVIAADVSEEMLAVARGTYARAGAMDTEFVVCDAESINEVLGARAVDAIICLRLMHRVPHSVRLNMLQAISATAPIAIVSFGVDSAYQRLRRKIRNVLFGGGEAEDLCLDRLSNIVLELERYFVVNRRTWVSRFVSEEIVFLLERRPAAGRTSSHRTTS